MSLSVGGDPEHISLHDIHICLHVQMYKHAHTVTYNTYRSPCLHGHTRTKIPACSHLLSDQGSIANWSNKSWHLGYLNQSHGLCVNFIIYSGFAGKQSPSFLTSGNCIWPQLFLSRHPQLSSKQTFSDHPNCQGHSAVHGEDWGSLMSGEGNDNDSNGDNHTLRIYHGQSAGCFASKQRPVCAPILWGQYNHSHFKDDDIEVQKG